METQKKVFFTVLKIEDSRKSDSVLETGVEYIGNSDGKRVYWTDSGSDQDWIFYIGDTCQINQ